MSEKCSGADKFVKFPFVELWRVLKYALVSVFFRKRPENLWHVHVVFTEAIGLFTLPLQPVFTLVVILAIGHQDQVYPKQKQTKSGCKSDTPEHLAKFLVFCHRIS
jgi:hypothetical protein